LALFDEPEMIGTMLHESEEEVLKRFPELLDAAEKGHSTIITRHGRPGLRFWPRSWPWVP